MPDEFWSEWSAADPYSIQQGFTVSQFPGTETHPIYNDGTVGTSIDTGRWLSYSDGVVSQNETYQEKSNDQGLAKACFRLIGQPHIRFTSDKVRCTSLK
jgi:hypothetical protein